MQSDGLSSRNGTMIFFIIVIVVFDVKGKPVCLVCGDALEVLTKSQFGVSLNSKHAQFNERGGQM